MKLRERSLVKRLTFSAEYFSVLLLYNNHMFKLTFSWNRSKAKSRKWKNERNEHFMVFFPLIVIIQALVNHIK